MSAVARALAALATTAALAAALPGAARANPLDNFGVGSRSVAMGGAVTADVQDIGAVYYNPAAYVRFPDIQASVGYFQGVPTLKVNGKNVEEDPTGGLVAGFTTPPMELLFGIELAGGALFHLPDKRVARTLAIPYDQPTYVLFGARNQRTVIMFPFSFGITDWLSIGAGIQLFVESDGGPNFVLVQDRAGNEKVFSEGTISAKQDPLFYPVAGFLVDVTDELRVGFDYRAKNETLYQVPIVVGLETLEIDNILDVPFLDLILEESSIDLDQQVFSFFAPEQFTLGLAWDANDDLTVTADLTFARWSAFKQPSPEGETFFTGGLEQLIPPNPNFPLPDPNFDDIWIPAVGAEWRAYSDDALDLFVRGGYRFRPTPAPKPTGFNNFADTDTHIVSVGLGVDFVDHPISIIPGPIELDAHGQFFFLEEVEVRKDSVVADAFGDLVLGGHVLTGGVMLTLHFE